MPKKTKGKQKDQVRQQFAEGPPIITLGSPQMPAMSEQMKSLNKINTTIVHPAGASPMSGHAEVASGSGAGDNWGSVPGTWGQPNPADDHEDEEEGNWGNGQWGQGDAGSSTNASPAMHTSPAPAGWGQEDHSAWNTGGGLASTIGKAFGFGANTDAANLAPGLSKKSTLKNTSAPTAPASKHVAFGAAHPSPAGGAPIPPPPPPPPSKGAPTSTNPQMNQPMRGRSHSQPQPGLVSAWGAAQGSVAGVPDPAAAWSQPQSHPHGRTRPRANTIAPAAPQASPTAATQAWMAWGRPKGSAVPQVASATTIAANVPTVQSRHPQSNPAADAALARAQLLQGQAHLTSQLQAAQLKHLLSHPGQFGLHHGQMHVPAEQSPKWQPQPKQSWQEWAKGKQESAQRGMGGQYGKPQAPKMELSQSWGSPGWTGGAGGYDGGGYGGGGYDGGGGASGWGGGSENGGDDGLENNNDGGWGTSAATGGGWGGGHSPPSWGAHGGEDERGRKSEHGRGRKKEKKQDAWGQSQGDAWGAANDPNAWGASDENAQWGSGGGGDAWGSSKGASGMGRASENHGAWDTIHEEDEDDEEYGEEEEYDEDEEDGEEDEHSDPWGQANHRHLRRTDHKQGKHKVGQRLSYEYRAPGDFASGGQSLAKGHAMAQLGLSSPMTRSAGRTPQMQRPPLLPNPDSSRTMNIATGRMNALFDATPPLSFHWAGGAGLLPAEAALYAIDRRLARERIHWGFNPQKDQRVSTLLAWIDKMHDELVLQGLSKFLETRQRGALIANADIRDTSTGRTQPVFDWISLEEVHETLDKNLQKYVVCYRPALTVLVFVFLLSQTGNSLAMWRKKLTVPHEMHEAYNDQVSHILEQQTQGRVIYIDEKTEPEPPPVPPKKKGFWRRLFSVFKSKKKLKKDPPSA